MLALLRAQLNKQSDCFVWKRGQFTACGLSIGGFALCGLFRFSFDHIGEDRIADCVQSKKGLSATRRRFQIAGQCKLATAEGAADTVAAAQREAVSGAGRHDATGPGNAGCRAGCPCSGLYEDR